MGEVENRCWGEHNYADSIYSHKTNDRGASVLSCVNWE